MRQIVVVLLVFTAIALYFWRAAESPSAAREERGESATVDSTTAASNIDPDLTSPGPVVVSDAPVNAVGLPCPTREPLGERDALMEEFKKQNQEIADRLGKSDDPEHLMALSLQPRWGESALARLSLTRAIQLSPSDPLFTWNELIGCSLSKDGSCDFDSVRTRAIEAGSDNGAVWMEIAAIELLGGDDEEASRSLRRAISAPMFSIHFVDNVLLLERAYAATSDWSFAERVFNAIGLVATRLPAYSPITSQCSESESNTDIWMDICEQLGVKMFDDGQAIITKMVGLALQDIVAQRGNDEEKKTQTRRRKDEFRKLFSETTKSGASILTENDERVLRNYVDDFSAYGEFEAQVRLGDEAKRLRATPDYDQCNFEKRYEY